MQKRLFFKAAMIAGLALLLLIPLSMIRGTISERAQRRGEAMQDIARTATGEQTVAGPVLALPYTLTRTLTRTIEGKSFSEEVTEQATVYFLPKQLDINGRISTEIRRRGLFEALLYGSDLELGGHFEVPKLGGLPLKPNEKIDWGTAYLAVGIEDNRGIQNAPQVEWGRQRYAFAPGNPITVLGNGIHAELNRDIAAGGRFDFNIKLKLQGTSRFGWIPMGEDTRVKLNSSWPHPSFIGRGVPLRHQITGKGFEAEWQTSHYATNMRQLFDQARTAGGVGTLSDQHVSVSFVQPVDIYQQAERSVKYGFLFVLLTFAAFALFEIMKRLPIHPVQYALVGVALALFFLLLIALSEHIRFGFSYGLAAAACVGLLTFYLSHVLRSVWRGLGFGGLLVLLYGALYGLLISEDNALLMGSLLLFVLLAGVMLLTRKVDWYALSEGDRAADTRRTMTDPAQETVTG